MNSNTHNLLKKRKKNWQQIEETNEKEQRIITNSKNLQQIDTTYNRN